MRFIDAIPLTTQKKESFEAQLTMEICSHALQVVLIGHAGTTETSNTLQKALPRGAAPKQVKPV